MALIALSTLQEYSSTSTLIGVKRMWEGGTPLHHAGAYEAIKRKKACNSHIHSCLWLLFLSRHFGAKTQCWKQPWTYIIKSTRSEATRGLARGWGIAAVLQGRIHRGLD